MTLRSIGLCLLACALGLLGVSRACLAQSPVQWSGDVRGSVARAAEQNLPLLFWVSKSRDVGDDDDLRDAQTTCFRDPVVVGIIQKHFVPVRVSRTSRVIEEAEKLGLPTTHSLYCAVITHDGRLLDQMGPMEVADPKGFAAHLNRAYDAYCDDLYTKELKPVFDDPEAPKEKVRAALQTVWRLGIRKADRDVVNVLSRTDLTPSQVSRLYEMLAGMSTEKTIKALLDRAEDKAAAAALNRASPAAIEWLLPAMPEAEGDVTNAQFIAYQATTYISRSPGAKGKGWWDKAKPDERRKELERVRAKAQDVLDYWRESQVPTE